MKILNRERIQDMETRTADIDIREGPGHEIRFTSGNVIYVEALIDDRWVGRYWSAEGRVNWLYEPWIEDAFRLEIDRKPVTTGWQWVSASEQPETERGARHFVVELSNNTHPISVKIHTLLDGTPVLKRWLEIRNTAERPVALTGVSPWSSKLRASTDYHHYAGGGFEHAFRLGYFTEHVWGWEGWFKWQPLPYGTTQIKGDKGPGFDAPFFIVHNQAKGEYLIGHLAWSANWTMEFACERGEVAHQESLRFRVGTWASDAQRVLSPGETITTPAVHLGLVAGDFDPTVQAMHDHLRRFVLPERKPERSYLIQYLWPADQGYPLEDAEGLTENTALANVDLAAAVGAELFTLDFGWWDATLDWFPSATRFPDGIKPVIEYVRDKGMLFGLYLETEGGRGNISESKVAQEHPEWIGPKQILNLTIPEAAAWMESEICRLIEQYELDLFRLDYNPHFTFEGPSTARDGITENNYWRYYEAFYDIYERVHEKYPDVILQQCAAGGGRNDLGVISRFHEPYLTDGLWQPHVLQNFAGQTLAFPPENFVIALGACGRWAVARPGNLDGHLRSTFTMSTPMLFAGMVAPNLDQMPPGRIERHVHFARIYKEFIRPLLATCKLYHHAPISSRAGVTASGWLALEYGTPDRTKGWATIVRIGPSDSDRYLLLPRGLDRGKRYRVTFDSSGETATLDGWELVRDGVPVYLESVLSSELLLFEEA
jgi:alpha-galactosidase